MFTPFPSFFFFFYRGPFPELHPREVFFRSISIYFAPRETRFRGLRPRKARKVLRIAVLKEKSRSLKVDSCLKLRKTPSLLSLPFRFEERSVVAENSSSFAYWLHRRTGRRCLQRLRKYLCHPCTPPPPDRPTGCQIVVVNRMEFACIFKRSVARLESIEVDRRASRSLLWRSDRERGGGRDR